MFRLFLSLLLVAFAMQSDSKPLLLLKGSRWSVDDEQFSIDGNRIKLARIENIEFSPKDHEVKTSQQVWDTSLALAKYLDQEREFPNGWRGLSVVELGAGQGVVGMALAHLGSSVTLTDLPAALPQLEANVAANELETKVHPLRWGSSDLSQEFDWAVAADCLWLDHLVEPFVQTLVKVAPRALVAYEERASRTIDTFKKLASPHFTLEEIQSDRHHPLFKSENIHILKLERN